MRAYALEVGINPDTTVDETLPHVSQRRSPRRAASSASRRRWWDHDLRWKGDLRGFGHRREAVHPARLTRPTFPASRARRRDESSPPSVRRRCRRVIQASPQSRRSSRSDGARRWPSGCSPITRSSLARAWKHARRVGNRNVAGDRLHHQPCRQAAIPALAAFESRNQPLLTDARVTASRGTRSAEPGGARARSDVRRRGPHERPPREDRPGLSALLKHEPLRRSGSRSRHAF